jgi:hypothetical protein
MLKPLLACLSLAALPAAALSQEIAASPEWKVSGSESGCIAHSTLPQGMVVSVLAGAGQESLLFLIQKREWAELRDGTRYKLAVKLDGRSDYSFDAVAKTELDSDGPGIMFAVAPGEVEGARFISEFSKAGGMAVGEGSTSIATVRLAGGGTAMTALAQCMSRLWNGGVASTRTPEQPAVSGSGKAVKL